MPSRAVASQYQACLFQSPGPEEQGRGAGLPPRQQGWASKGADPSRGRMKRPSSPLLPRFTHIQKRATES